MKALEDIAVFIYYTGIAAMLLYTIVNMSTTQERKEASERALQYRCPALTHQDSSRIALEWYMRGLPPYPPRGYTPGPGLPKHPGARQKPLQE